MSKTSWLRTQTRRIPSIPKLPLLQVRRRSILSDGILVTKRNVEDNSLKLGSIKILPPLRRINKRVEVRGAQAIRLTREDGRSAISFLLLGDGAELPAVAQGPVRGGGAVATNLHEATAPSHPRHHCGGRLLGRARQLDGVRVEAVVAVRSLHLSTIS